MIGIDPNKSVAPITDQKKADNAQKTKNNDFQDVYQQAIGNVKTDDMKAEMTSFVSEMRPVQFETQAQPPTSIIVNQVDQLIDTMDIYRQQLSEKNATLKDIEPTIEKIAKQSESLSAISKNVSLEDGLRSIVDQSLSLSAKEVLSYKSGHYNDA